MTTTFAHRDGVPWWEATLPPSKHDCTPQTAGWLRGDRFVERCACGAVRIDHVHWLNKNERRGK